MSSKRTAKYFPFGEYRPDSAQPNTPYLTTCLNVMPTATGYRRAKRWAAIGGGGALTGTALDGIAASFNFGGISGLDIIAGTATALFAKRPGDAAWTDITRAAGGAYAATYWSFCTFGADTLAVNGVDAPQTYITGNLSDATALGGSPPTFNFIAACGDFVFGLGTSAATTTLRWSGINDSTSWTVGTDLCDEQTFPDGGELFGAYGDKEGYILQRDAIRRFRFLPGDVVNIFEFDKLDGVPGCVNAKAWAVYGDTVYYLSVRGLVALNTSGVRFIGQDRVDLRATTLGVPGSRVTADIFNGQVIFPGSISFPNSALAYDVTRDRWVEEETTESSNPVPLIRLTRTEATSSSHSYQVGITSDGLLIGRSTNGATAQIQIARQEPFAPRRTNIHGLKVDDDSGAAANDEVGITINTQKTALDSGVDQTGRRDSNAGTYSIDAAGVASGFLFYIKADYGRLVTWTYTNGVWIWMSPDGEI